MSDPFIEDTNKCEVVLLNYPRCGSTFLHYCIQELYGLYMCKHHGQSKKFWKEGPFNLIFMIRNYKECIPRQTRSKELHRILSHCRNAEATFDYISVLRYFDEVDSKKMIIYYEDFIIDTEKTIREVVEFLNEFDMQPADLDRFLDNIEQHRANSLKKYIPGSVSGGNKLIFHSNDISGEIKKKIDKHLMDNYGYLYNKYLKRYEELERK